MNLQDIIRDKIKEDGAISFCDFMDMCLYYPELGYYTSASDKIGINGDYYTSPTVTPAFGAMIGRQLAEMWNNIKSPVFTIVEYGAGTGILCHDILDYFRENNRELAEKIQYYIIEKSPVMQQKEKEYLSPNVRWVNSLADIGKFSGCVLSNELLDNFPVHQVVMKEQLMEVFVDYKNGFREILLPAKDMLKNYLCELNVQLPTGFRTEINLQAVNWLKRIAQFLEKGYVLTIDYGHTSAELYQPKRSCGTIMCYHKHSINDDPYHAIGEQDITSHVNFSALRLWGQKNGLITCGITDQESFLTGFGFIEYVKKLQQKFHLDSRKIWFILETLLADMGKKYKVLIQQKGTKTSSLDGLKLKAT